MEKERCFLCRDQLPYREYIPDCRKWTGPSKGLEKRLFLLKEDCVEVEISLETFIPMSDLKGRIPIFEPAKKYIHKECAEKYLDGKPEKNCTFQWHYPYDDLLLQIQNIKKIKEVEGKTTYISVNIGEKGWGWTSCGNCKTELEEAGLKKCPYCRHTFKGTKKRYV